MTESGDFFLVCSGRKFGADPRHQYVAAGRKNTTGFTDLGFPIASMLILLILYQQIGLLSIFRDFMHIIDNFLDYF